MTRRRRMPVCSDSTFPKLIFFDVEGTIFRKVVKDSHGNTAPSAWGLLAAHLGPDAVREDDETKVKWTAGQYKGYVEWMEATIAIHQKYRLDKAFFDAVMELCVYHPGVAETFRELRSKGVRTALISGGFKATADRAARDLKIDHALAACEYYWNAHGELVWWNLLPCDYHGKADFMKLISQEHGLTLQECAFVGDGRNDIALAKAVGISIAFNGAPELQAVCSHSINQAQGEEDFTAILPCLKNGQRSLLDLKAP